MTIIDNLSMHSSNTSQYFEDHVLDFWNPSVDVNDWVCNQVSEIGKNGVNRPGGG